MRDQVASVTQPIMRLIHFQPVSLASERNKRVALHCKRERPVHAG
ncbi:MAG: hypothetical protein ACLRS8_11710 [Parabacteroides merdae]